MEAIRWNIEAFDSRSEWESCLLESPRMPAVAVGCDFAAWLERAIARSERLRSRDSLLIEEQRFKLREPEG
jgi:hypothetical protein